MHALLEELVIEKRKVVAELQSPPDDELLVEWLDGKLAGLVFAIEAIKNQMVIERTLDKG